MRWALRTQAVYIETFHDPTRDPPAAQLARECARGRHLNAARSCWLSRRATERG
jgi:hypothetical protein